MTLWCMACLLHCLNELLFLCSVMACMLLFLVLIAQVKPSDRQLLLLLVIATCC
jgi:hypothetical protein